MLQQRSFDSNLESTKFEPTVTTENEELLQDAIAAHQGGDLNEAEQLYRAILGIQPSHPDANHNLGVLNLSLNKVESALLLFHTALRVNQASEQYWLSYIDALIKLNRLEEARAAVAAAKTHKVSGSRIDAKAATLAKSQPQTVPADPRLSELLPLGNKKVASAEQPVSMEKAVMPAADRIHELLALYQRGRLQEAEEKARCLSLELPEHPFPWKVLGAIYAQSGQLEEALQVNQQAVKLSPSDHEALNNLGIVQKDLGMFQDSRRSLETAIKIKDDFAEAYSNLGNTLFELRLFDEAQESLKKAVKIRPGLADAHYNLGRATQELGEIEGASLHYERALSINPEHANALLNLGTALQQQNKLGQARSRYNQSLAIQPDLAAAHRQLANIKRFKSKDSQFKTMRNLQRRADLAERDMCHINFALAKAYEDLGDVGLAYKHYLEGNALRKRELQYEPATEEVFFNCLKNTFRDLQKIRLRLPQTDISPVPIFVLGMPRSGTSLVEQIIGCHSQVFAAGELSYAKNLGRDLASGEKESSEKALIDFRENYLFHLRDKSEGFPIVTDKMPHNFHYIGLISLTIPEAKIVHVHRHPAAVCWGNFKQFFENPGLGYTYGLQSIAQYYKLYFDLMTFWFHSSPHDIFNLQYEKLTTDQESVTRQLLNYLGLPWEDKCLEPHKNNRIVRTASNLQVRKKIYQGSSRKWKLYEPYLAGIFNDLPEFST